MTFRVGDYQADELIGSGGSAQVYRGVRISDEYPVAIKSLPPEGLAALQREAALAAELNHPHVPAVLDVLVDTERCALVTELASAGSLEELLDRRGRLTEAETLTVLIPVSAVLAVAHEREVVHGDLAAGNILFDAGGRPLLGDLGAARAIAEAGLPVHLTVPHAAPEVARGDAPSAASDLFALGSIALCCVTGHPAWPADDLHDVLIQAAAGQWPDPGDAVADPVLARTIRALLDPVPQRRPGAAAVIVGLRSATAKPAPIDFGTEAVQPTVSTGARAPEQPEARAGQDLNGPAFLDPRLRDPEQMRRARAVTKLRPDAVSSTSDETAIPSPDRTRRILEFVAAVMDALTRRSGQARHRRSDSPSASTRGRTGPPGEIPRRSWGRTAALVVSCLAIVASAVQVGLWWAGWDRSTPTATAPAATAPTATAPIGTAPIGTAPIGTAPTVAAPGTGLAGTTASSASALPSGRTGPSVSGPVRSGVSSAALSRPGTTLSRTATSGGSAHGTSQAAPATDPAAPATDTAAPTTDTAAPATDTAAPAAAASSTEPTGVNWVGVVNDLDRARGRAVTARDPVLLDLVYTPDSPVKAVDAALIGRLNSAGLHVSGATHRILSVALRHAGSTVEVAVTDALPVYQVTDPSGVVVGRTTGRGAATRVLLLRGTAVGYRIADVRAS